MSEILHMVPSSCETVRTNITSVQSSLNEQLTTLSAAVTNMVGTDWIAPGATQFQGDFQEWQAAMTTQISQLENYTSRLAIEIEQWRTSGQTS